MATTQEAKAAHPKTPICPTCAKPMRVQSSAPDRTYHNLQQVIFVCDCGRTTEVIVADMN